ncbi:MAG: glycoside hydrolase family 127 protein [Planctomycetota bacterium]
MKRLPWMLVTPLWLACAASTAAADQERSAMLTAVPFTDVRLDDRFWSPRFETNRTVTVPYCFTKCQETGRIDNFAKAGGLMPGAHVGHRYNDSDVFKVIEGAAYALRTRRDPELERYIDDLIAKIAAAQEDDGYLFTTRTIDPRNPANASGAERWSYIAHSHELYNVGHMYEAAVAYEQATGKRALLEVAIENADLIDREFGPGRRHDPPGHEEIEIGLVKLYRATGEDRYLNLAKFFIDQRGRADGRELYGIYAQDHVPVVEQSEPVGHAVRAMYLYSGMADVAAVTGDADYLAALDRIWDDLVRTRLYLTGGIGASQSGEAFGEPYELPNASAYNETCAAVGNALWNHRMSLLHRDAKYADILERVIYNGFLSGVSLSGDAFFYPNPLASGGTYHRSPWFSCSCCPVNVVRFVPSIAGYVYAHDDDEIFVNLFAASGARVVLPTGAVAITQATDYPWDGKVVITVEPESAADFALNVRVPGWATGSPVPSDLYEYVSGGAGGNGVSLSVNGKPIRTPEVDRGYARLTRRWERGDTITVELDMPVRLVRCHENVTENRGRLAIERGPIVYCLEAIDNGGHVRNIWMPADGELVIEQRTDLLGGITVVKGKAFAMRRDVANGPAHATPIDLTAVPYYAWDHRDPGEMTVWIPTSPELVRPVGPPTVASTSRVSASHCWESDSILAVNDQLEPEGSGDHSIPRLTWWDHLGTSEWVQYDFDEPRWVSSTSVYWFDDTGVGRCRVPATWRLLYRQDDAWKPVPAPSGYGVQRDVYNRVEFDPVETSALRIEVQLRPDCSGGILEWRFE